MKKLLAILLAAMMTLTLAACGDNNKTDTDKDDSKASQTENSSAILDESVNWDDVESALDVLEGLKPEGWDENNFYSYIYERLPCLNCYWVLLELGILLQFFTQLLDGLSKKLGNEVTKSMVLDRIEWRKKNTWGRGKG